jgi:hypothetical protein
MAWQGIVSYRAEPQAVLDVIHPAESFVLSASWPTVTRASDRVGHDFKRTGRQGSMPRGTCDGKKQSVERAGGFVGRRGSSGMFQVQSCCEKGAMRG